jgi:hypothetical protein
MDSIPAASGSRTNPAQLAASEHRARTQEQDAVSVASPGSNPTHSPVTTQPHPTLTAQHLSAVEAKSQAQAETQQASRDAGIPEVYGEVNPARPGQVFSLSL